MTLANYHFVIDRGTTSYFCEVDEVYDETETYFEVTINSRDHFELHFDCDSGNLKIKSPENLPVDLLVIEESLSDRICAMYS